MQKDNKSLFQNLTVVELASALAGPSVGMFFAELGARVIKIENKTTGGDVTRRWKHSDEAKDDPFSAYYFSVNWGKEVVMLNLKQEADRCRVHDIIKEADVVISNFKYGSAIKLGMDYDTLRNINKAIIYGNVFAYDEDDPRPGFDALLQAETGWMSMNGQAVGLPTKVPLPIVDILAGHQLKEGILIGLLQREKTGEGCQLSVSLYDASLSAMTNQASTFLNLGIVPKRIGSQHPTIAPYGDVVTTSDGKDILLACGTEEHFKSLCEALNMPWIKSDSRFLTNQDRLENRDLLIELLQDAISEMTASELEDRCFRLGIPIGPVRSLDQVFEEKDGKELILNEKHEDGRISKRVKTAVFKFFGESS